MHTRQRPALRTLGTLCAMEPQATAPLGPGFTVYTLDGVLLGRIDAVTLEAFRVKGSAAARWLLRDAVHHTRGGKLVFLKARHDELDPWTWKQPPNPRVG